MEKKEKYRENLKRKENVPVDQAFISCEELLIYLVSIDCKRSKECFLNEI